jgi:hypothetical protein
MNLNGCDWPERLAGTMEESGEQCTVVFALIVTEPAIESVSVL